MSQQKAASLTSSLIVRKGRASPASLVISELEGDTLNGSAPAPQHLHAAHEGEAMKLSALALGGQTGRRKTRESEVELPLLAYVEAQVAADVAPKAPPDEAGATPHEESAPAERRPAASLLDRGTRAPGKAEGRVVTGSEAPEVAGASATVEPAAAAPAATVSGDANVTAIVDAAEEAAPQSPDKEAAANENGAKPEVAVAAAPVLEAPVLERQAVRDSANSATPERRKVAAPHAEPVVPAAGRAAAVPAPPPVVKRSVPWRSAAVIALGAALGLGAYVMLSAPSEEGPLEVAVRTSAPPAGEVAAAPSVPASDAAPSVPAPEAAASAPVADNAPPAAAAPEPSFDIIRIEPDGQSIIAGRAVPFSEWILLNNGEPIASIKADANGEWVVLPDASLVPGANAFSLVPKAEQGRVAIPAPAAPSLPQAVPQPALPEAGAPSGDAAPGPRAGPGDAGTPRSGAVALPKPKPAVPAADLRAATEGGYEVQIASVRDAGDAERERRRLLQAYPQLLGSLELQVQTAAVEGAGTFYRVRSGTMADLGKAREVCRRLEAAGQGCLVVRRAPASEAADAVAPQPRRSAPQQAERPQ